MNDDCVLLKVSRARGVSRGLSSPVVQAGNTSSLSPLYYQTPLTALDKEYTKN